MPIYEYRCEECGKKCEVVQKFTDDPLTICRECGGRLHKLISQTTFILKGTGWYVTDYASPGRRKAEDASSAAPGDAEATGAASEAKAETKAESKAESAVRS